MEGYNVFNHVTKISDGGGSGESTRFTVFSVWIRHSIRALQWGVGSHFKFSEGGEAPVGRNGGIPACRNGPEFCVQRDVLKI